MSMHRHFLALCLTIILPLPLHLANPSPSWLVMLKSNPWWQSDELTVPFITWGGDMVTFHANGGLKPNKAAFIMTLA